MTNSRARGGARRLTGSAAAALLWLIAAAPAVAQTPAAGLQPVAPPEIAPENTPETAPETAPDPARRLTPRRLMPRRAAPAPAPAPATPSATGLLPAPVASDPLAVVDPDSLGVLDTPSGGLGIALWQGLDREQARMLLAAMPGQYRNAALRDLARRLLLTTAAAPAGEPAPDAPGLLQLRLDKLLAMGAAGDARRLLDAVPQGRLNGPLLALRLDLDMLANDIDGVCTLARREIERFPIPPLRRAVILCQARDGQTAAAAFGLTLLGDEGLADAYFAALVRRIADSTAAPTAIADVPAPGRLTPLHLAALRVAGAAPPADALSRATPAVLASLATAGPGAPADRLAAGMRAARSGALDTAALATLFANHGFREEDLARPISRASELPPAEGLALLYRAAQAQTVRAARAEAVLTALRQAAAGGTLPTVARLLAPLTAAVDPAPELSWFATAAARLALLTGDRDRADAWRAGITASTDAENPADRPGLTLARGLAAMDGPPLDDAAAAWAAARRDGAPGPAVADVFALLDALGRSDPETLWRIAPLGEAAAPADGPDIAAWHRLALARDSGHIGETVLLALLLAGGEAPGSLSFARAVAALAAIGLTGEASAAALEAVIGGGL